MIMKEIYIIKFYSSVYTAIYMCNIFFDFKRLGVRCYEVIYTDVIFRRLHGYYNKFMHTSHSMKQCVLTKALLSRVWGSLGEDLQEPRVVRRQQSSPGRLKFVKKKKKKKRQPLIKKKKKKDKFRMIQ